MNRQEIIETYRKNPHIPVLIIGAGVNGIGTFRDLALQGIHVLLIDKGDFCSGASAASSHMVHGGLRYLENGEFRLVREAVQERNLLIQNAPHYVKPLPTTIPIFKWFSGLLNAPLKFFGLINHPSERGAVVIKLGLILYDIYSRQGVVPKHSFAFRKQSLTGFPSLPPNIICTATYFDAAMSSPERLCLEMLLDAEAVNPLAKAINYVRVERASTDSLTLSDQLSGEQFTVKPNIVINATGAWIDFTNQVMKRQTHFMGGTKGSHLVLNHPKLRQALGDHEFFFENKDGRIVLIFPLMDKVLVGTSDLPIHDPEEARCTEAEIDYFLEMIKVVFPYIPVDRSHIVFQFSGVRPLPATNASTPGQISRDHSIQVIEPGEGVDFPIFCLIGGKWTSFRAFSEQVTDAVLDKLGFTRKRSTNDLPIGGGHNYPQSTEAVDRWLQTYHHKTGLFLERSRLLFERYGTRAEELARFSGKDDQPLTHKPDYTRNEVTFLAQKEKVVHLDDLILRRTLIAMLGELTTGLLYELAEVVGKALGWSASMKQAEIERTLHILADRHGVIIAR
ncbi:MAG: glycerol-3-phosphate dehydrogenase/oxidase [Chloroflexota bacterium]